MVGTGRIVIGGLFALSGLVWIAVSVSPPNGDGIGFGTFSLIVGLLLVAWGVSDIQSQRAAQLRAYQEEYNARAEAARRAYEAAPKCPYCQAPNTMQEKSRKVLSQTKGYGMVDRVETHLGVYGDPSKTKVIRRQERVPIVISTMLVEGTCSYCGRTANTNLTITEEDFSRELPPPPPPTDGSARGVTVNIPAPPPQIMRRCAHCAAVYPEASLRCPSCGASF